MAISKNIYVPILIATVSVIFVDVIKTRRNNLYKDMGILLNHTVTTEDGYILTLHRIPYGREKNSKKRIPVLFMHGFLQSGADFTISGPNKSLSLLLADRGYDIWLGNARGTTYSRKHKHLDPDNDSQFWDFSLHEIAVYDVSAFIDYILKETKEETLHYIGYSQGTSIFFILCSEKPKYVEKVKLMTALSPAIFLKNPESPLLKLLVVFRKFAEVFFNFTGIKEFLPNNHVISHYLRHVCDENSFFVELCLHHTMLLHGYNKEQVNKTLLAVYFTNTPAGASSKQLLHIVQWMESGEFHQYDLGTTANLEKYGQEVPPRYDLSKITTPVALYYSSNDWSVNIKNIEKIDKNLPNVVKMYQVPLETFNHNDFITARQVYDLLYQAVIEEIVKY